MTDFFITRKQRGAEAGEGVEAVKSESIRGMRGDMLFSSDESFFHPSVSQLFFLLRENMNICVCFESVNNGTTTQGPLNTHTEACLPIIHTNTHLPCGLGDVMFVVGWAAPD